MVLAWDYNTYHLIYIPTYVPGCLMSSLCPFNLYCLHSQPQASSLPIYPASHPPFSSLLSLLFPSVFIPLYIFFPFSRVPLPFLLFPCPFHHVVPPSTICPPVFLSVPLTTEPCPYLIPLQPLSYLSASSLACLTDFVPTT